MKPNLKLEVVLSRSCEAAIRSYSDALNDERVSDSEWCELRRKAADRALLALTNAILNSDDGSVGRNFV